jgi:hypothetical protein
MVLSEKFFSDLLLLSSWHSLVNLFGDGFAGGSRTVRNNPNLADRVTVVSRKRGFFPKKWNVSWTWHCILVMKYFTNSSRIARRFWVLLLAKPHRERELGLCTSWQKSVCVVCRIIDQFRKYITGGRWGRFNAGGALVRFVEATCNL